jgi:hypothetical protein
MIRIASGHEFGKLIAALSSDVVDAHVHWRLHCDLHEAIQAHPIVWSQSRTFWQLTLTAHAETAVENLCRVFDQEQSSLHLLSWLRTIRTNLHLFDTAEFKRRRAGTPFVDSLAEDPRSPDLAALEADINDCTATDPLVKKLMVHRGNAVAHRGAKRAISDEPLPLELTLSVEDLEVLLSRARTVLNRYCQLFAAETYSVSMIGRDDYKFIFSSVAAAVERSRRAARG